jgi:hypothetical protein
MARYTTTLKGDFNDFLNHLNNDIMGGSISVSYEDGADVEMNGVRTAVRVYERYSMIGGNRVSMNVTVVGRDDDIYVCAISSGGSQAVFFKINTFGESAFLDLCRNSVHNYEYNPL